MSVGTHDADNVKGSKIPSYVGTGLGVAGILINEGIGLKYPNTGADDDPDSKLAKYSVLVLQLMGTVLFVIESLYINPEEKKAKDALALTGIIAEWGLLLMVFSAICAASVGPYMIYNDTVHLGNNGDITLLGLKIANFAADKQIVNSPLTGGGNFLPERGKWYERLLDFIKDHWWQLGLGVLGIAGAGVGAKFTVDKMNSLSEEQEKLLGELNEL
jgi:hypothetical protein